MESKINEIESKEDFLHFLSCLINDKNHKKDNDTEWENKTLTEYLDAIHSWIEDMDGYYQNMKISPPDNIDWSFIATLFYVGKIYE